MNDVYKFNFVDVVVMLLWWMTTTTIHSFQGSSSSHSSSNVTSKTYNLASLGVNPFVGLTAVLLFIDDCFQPSYNTHMQAIWRVIDRMRFMKGVISTMMGEVAWRNNNIHMRSANFSTSFTSSLTFSCHDLHIESDIWMIHKRIVYLRHTHSIWSCQGNASSW